ncbi:nucleoside-diphosphate kinase [Rhizobium redzepovicii]|uniref:Nucleoside-diphosphate kinase n=1 Tax=Rhizobium redzepovicii TaxID=2867518 RepID=A0AAW8P9L7_9HYPH|nr:nucleoside-diphosphate kinase [Rhizobium redzepovicii]MDR9762824.1 nucleoside-diphosphate kinase [Rhizobium redzepovicii]MDR9780947.1 nucleoside-diphosphate kinase [Rhizobium redzepovicii]
MNDQCLLTTKDYTLLETMHDDPLVRDTALLRLLRRKKASAIVMFREDLPDDVASLNSRVTFSVDARCDTRVLTTGRMTTPVGMLLPVDTLRGLALLGLREGQTIVIENVEGHMEAISLDAVNYQPERMRRSDEFPMRIGLGGKPILRLVQGVGPACSGKPPEEPDDPGPSAA